MQTLEPAKHMSARRQQILYAMGIKHYRRPGAKPAPIELQDVEAIPTEPRAPALLQDALPSASLPNPRAARSSVNQERTRSTTIELVLPAADIAWFAPSRFAQHLKRALRMDVLSIVANSDRSDTALYFDMPGQLLLKLGGIARLRTQWRARRDAFLALRVWRKSLSKT
jgi:hypothetical protein